MTPASPPSDPDGTVNGVTLQSRGTYTGGVSVNNSTGVVTLTNAAPLGTHTLTVRVTDNCGATTDAAFMLNVVCPAITVTAPTAATVAVGAAFNQSFTQTGGSGTIGFTLPSGALPNGFALATNGALSGTTTQAGIYNLTIRATDANGCTGTAAYTLTVTNTTPTISAANVAHVKGATANAVIANVSDPEQAANSLTVQVNNVASAMVNGVTVSGLTIDGAGAVTANVAASCTATDATFTLKVIDSAGASATAALNVTVTAATLAITTQPVARTVSANTAASFSVAANGSNLSYQWRRNAVALTNGWNVQGATTAALTLNPTLANDAGSYDVIVTNGCGTVTSTAAMLTVNGGGAAPLLVSEFRFSGPQGAGDWYLELYNNTDAPLRTNGLVIAFADALGQLAESFPLTLDRTISAKGYYLIAGPQYSLSLAAVADQSLPIFATLRNVGGVGLFADALQPTKRLDSLGAQGFAQSAALQYFIEVAALPALANTLVEHAFVRKFSNTGLPTDTNNNLADFILLAIAPTPINGVTPQPGAPGPQNIAAPALANSTLPVTMLNPAIYANNGPNTVVESVPVTVGSATYPRSLYLRRTLTNNTGSPVKKLRFRITELSNGGVNTAILRALNSDDITATIGGQPVTVKGLTLEAPTQPTGGSVNSTLSVGSITLAAPLANGAKINVQFRLGIVQGGSYRFFANVEASN